MQLIQKAALAGYKNYTSGLIEPKKLPDLLKKLKKKYSTNLTRQQAYRRKLQGLGNAKLFAHSSFEDTSKFYWVLLVTDGKHPAHTEENLNDLLERKSRLRYDLFELTQQPSNTGKPSFTWRLTKTAFNGYQELIRNEIRLRSITRCEHLAEDLGNMPGFSGIREQRKKFIKVWKGEARRYFKPAEEINIKNFFARMKKAQEIVYVQKFVSELERHDRKIYEQLRIYNKNLKTRPKSP